MSNYDRTGRLSGLRGVDDLLNDIHRSVENDALPVRQYTDESMIRRFVNPPFSFRRPGECS
jgi:hypothetical protein